MNSNNIYSFIIIAVCAITVSCKKDNPTATFIEVGVSDKLIISQLDTVIKGELYDTIVR